MSWFLTPYLRLTNALDERREGQGLAEYALSLVLVSIVAFAAWQSLGTHVSTVLSKVGADL